MRRDAHILALEAKLRAPVEGDIVIMLTLHPPTRRNRDRDNGLARCKSLLDGVADALKVNDSRFRASAEYGEPVEFGCVLLEIVEP